MMNLRGHAALITGATTGIGQAVAGVLAEAGADVVVHGKPGEDPSATLALCQEAGVQAHTIEADFCGPPEQVAEAVYRQATEALPHLDIVISNAGGHQGESSFETVDLEVLERTLRLHIVTPYALLQRFVRRWLEQDVAGRVVIVGSINGLLAEPESTAYDTAKGGITMMIRSLAADLAGRGIRINGIAPGMIRTDRTAWLDEASHVRRWFEHHTPNRQVPGPDSCARAVAFLVSDGADHVHGQMLCVDGGMSAWQQPGPM